MRVLRVFLAMILTVGPVQAQPVVDLLARYSIRPDETAAAAPEDDAPPGSGKQLSVLEANLALISEALEGFAHPQDAEKALLAAKPRLPAGVAPFFKDRATSLNALYRTLAIVDYTWALRFPNPPCAPAAKRSALLRSEDGLFMDPVTGKTSAWMIALLGPGSIDRSLESALDRASATSVPSEAAYARLRARQNTITKALSSEGAVGEARAGLYCQRAETRLELAVANRVGGPVLAARSSQERVSRQGVVIIAGVTAEGLEARGAGIVIDTKSGIRVLTDRRLGTGEIAALFDDKAPVALFREREDEKSGLLLLRPEGDLGEPLILADAAPKKDDLVFALGHSDRLGAWTKTQGLVTSSAQDVFQTDAVADASMTGGAILEEEGRVAGLLVLRRVEGASIDWPAAVSAPILRAWIEGGESPSSAPIILTDSGTTRILTASRPLLQSVAVGEGATAAGYGFDTQTQWGTVHAKCVANCDDSGSGSSYSDNGSAELGQALGKLAAVGVQALIFKGIPALFRGLGSLFKSKPHSTQPRYVENKPAITPLPAPIQEVKVDPPPIECRVTKVNEPAKIGIDTVEIKVQFSCDDPSVPVGNRRIEFTLGWEHEESQYKAIIATTDANGYASISFRIDNAVTNAARSFHDLDQYDSERMPHQAVDANAKAESESDVHAPDAGGLINASDSKPSKRDGVKSEPPVQEDPKPSNNFVYALTGTGRTGVRSVARVVADREAVGAVASRAAAGTVARSAAGSSAEGAAGSAAAIGLKFPASRPIKIGVAAVSFALVWTVVKFAGNAERPKRIPNNNLSDQPVRQNEFDALEKEVRANRDDEDECSKLAQSGDTFARFVDNSRLAPGYLQIHEDLGGHTILEHVDGRDTETHQPYVIERLANEKHLTRASVYINLQTAEEITREMVKVNQMGIESWIMTTNSPQRAFSYIGNVNIGYGVSIDNGEPVTRRNARTILRRMGKCKILIRTSFPE